MTEKPRHRSVAREIAEIEFEAEERAFNLSCDFLEDNGFAEAAAALTRFAFGPDAGDERQEGKRS